MFDRVVDRYDLLNAVLSLGQDRRWRRLAAGAVPVAPGELVLDLGCGTGRLAQLLPGRASVVGLDLSAGMLSTARRRVPSLALVQGSAFRLPFADGAFAGAVSGFVLRNLADLPLAFAELARVVRPGGVVALVDATEPPPGLYRRLFDVYFGTVAAVLGVAVGRAGEYRYLARSLGQIPRPDVVCGMLAGAGLDAPRWRRLAGGAVTLFTAVRSR